MPETSPCSFEIQPYDLLICLHGNHQVDVHHIHRRIWQRAEEQFDTCVMNDDALLSSCGHLRDDEPGLSTYR